MLCLMRKVGESITIGDDITVVINNIKGNQVHIGITAPRNMEILRDNIKTIACTKCNGKGGHSSMGVVYQKCLACGGTGVKK